MLQYSNSSLRSSARFARRRLKRWEERLQDAEVKVNMSQADIDMRRDRAREEIKTESQEATARGLAEVEIARRKLNQAVEEFEQDRRNLRSSISKVEAEQDAKFRAFNAERLEFESRVKKFKEEKVRVCEERSDELRRHVGNISTPASRSTIPNTANATFHATRFARHFARRSSSSKSRRPCSSRA